MTSPNGEGAPTGDPIESQCAAFNHLVDCPGLSVVPMDGHSQRTNPLKADYLDAKLLGALGALGKGSICTARSHAFVSRFAFIVRGPE